MPIPAVPTPRVSGTRWGHSHGLTLVEMMLVVSVMAIVSAIAVPSVLAGLDQARASAAARHVASRARLTRMDAVKRAAKVALVFNQEGPTYSYACYLDTNGNGVSRADIALGTDRQVCPVERLEHQFPGVMFGVADGVEPIDSGDPLSPGSDPIRLGRADSLTFSPSGTATSGTLYIRGRTNQQFAVRILGVTGRTRVLEFHPRARRWFER